MRIRPYWLILLIGGSLLVPGCSSGPQEGSPGHTVQQFFERLNDGNYDSAKALYDADALQAVDDPAVSSPEAFSQWALSETKRGTLSDVRILESETGESEAQIDYELRYMDGSSKRGSVRLTQEQGQWRLGLVS